MYHCLPNSGWVDGNITQKRLGDMVEHTYPNQPNPTRVLEQLGHPVPSPQPPAPPMASVAIQSYFLPGLCGGLENERPNERDCQMPDRLLMHCPQKNRYCTEKAGWTRDDWKNRVAGLAGCRIKTNTKSKWTPYWKPKSDTYASITGTPARLQ